MSDAGQRGAMKQAMREHASMMPEANALSGNAGAVEACPKCENTGWCHAQKKCELSGYTIAAPLPATEDRP